MRYVPKVPIVVAVTGKNRVITVSVTLMRGIGGLNFIISVSNLLVINSVSRLMLVSARGGLEEPRILTIDA
jgi:mRNA-degrading endonuclease toxin of MazEF toxin-antitoxin module